MAIDVFAVFVVRDGALIEERPWPRRAGYRPGDVARVLTDLASRGDGTGPKWEIHIEIGKGPSARLVKVPLAAFLTIDEYRASMERPFSFSLLASSISPSPPIRDASLTWLWLYRDTFYVTERAPTSYEADEVMLRIKLLRYQHDEELNRLKEQVANYEAIEGQRAGGTTRKAIPDDVRMLVWSRDKGSCVKCGAVKELHFDHVIPLARGGSDEAVNIQLLCRTCNLAKGDRIV
jgi:hypothetical protein